jgi:hypothetical protein
MPLWQWVLDAVGLLLLLALILGAALVVRRRMLSRHGGTFELSLRSRSAPTGSGWVLGLGRYSGDTLEWFRIFSLAPRPKRTWQRDRLTYDGQRVTEESEHRLLYPGHVIIACTTPKGPIELALSPGSLTGFQAWLESRSPGTDWSR